MGVCYYLWRADTRTAYDLGKANGWGEVFGQSASGRDDRTEPMILLPADASTLADLLCKHLLDDGRIEPEHVERWLEYLERVCADIAAWSEGKPFTFVSEHAGCIEDRAMEASDADYDDAWVTGSRFIDRHPEWPTLSE